VLVDDGGEVNDGGGDDGDFCDGFYFMSEIA